MKNAALIRKQIEESLSARIPVALSPRTRTEPEYTPCGIPAVDALLHGGLAEGVLTEFVGAECSGRTTVALACLAATTRAGHVGAWIDVADTLDPETAAANSVDLERLLWIRCGARRQVSPQIATQSTDVMLSASAAPFRHTGGGSLHPRSEGRDMPEAVGALLRPHGGLYDKQRRREKRFIGTPGAPNRPVAYRAEHREEQVNSDRLPPRRGENLSSVAVMPRRAEPQPWPVASLPSRKQVAHKQSAHLLHGEGSRSSKPWHALDQALRATDLLLQNGGFNVIVLDLGSTPPEIAWRIPLATWFRFRAACERTRASLVLLTQHPCARSSAELVLRLQPGSVEAEGRVMTGIRYCAATERSRSPEMQPRVVSIRRPPQSERMGAWTSEVAWAQAR